MRHTRNRWTSQFKDRVCEMDDIDTTFRNDQVFFFLVRGSLVLNFLQVFKNNSKIIGKHGICQFTHRSWYFTVSKFSVERLPKFPTAVQSRRLLRTRATTEITAFCFIFLSMSMPPFLCECHVNDAEKVHAAA